MAGAEFQDVAGEFAIPLDVEALADEAALRVWDKGLSYECWCCYRKLGLKLHYDY